MPRHSAPAASSRTFQYGSFGIGACAASLLVWQIGWGIAPSQQTLAVGFSIGLAMVAVALEIVRLLRLAEGPRARGRSMILLAITLLALVQIGVAELLYASEEGRLALRGTGLLLLATSQLTLVLAAMLRLLRLADQRWLSRTSPGVLVLGSFVLAIALGTLLLKTPRATVDGITWLDALFTSTSAVCVTGLIVVDTATAFTFTGQAIILGLIQIGGLGVMTLAYFMALMAGQGVSLRDRVFLNEMLSQNNVLRIGRFVARIVLITLIVEAIGVVLIHRQWSGNPEAMWNSVFHSVSAFCNAGFSTFSAGLMDESARNAYGVQFVIMILIVIGGLGFVVAGQAPGLAFAPLRRRIARYFGRRGAPGRVPVHVRLVLATTGLLLAGGAIGFWLLDAGSPWVSLFNSVTARTAGFNISDMGELSHGAVVLMCFLMIVGGSPGGTAGGIKTTTFALGVLELRRIVLGRRDVNLWGRRISRDVLDRCHATLVLALLWIAASAAIVGAMEPAMRFSDVVFECVSAFGTVGLSRGITADLGIVSKLTIIVTMLVGRIGILAFAMTLGGQPRPRHFQYPEARLPLN